MRSALLAALCIALAGCALVSPEGTVRARLIEAGLRPHMAACLAPKLVRKLSRSQLETLGRLASAPREDGRHLSLGALEDRLQALNDPQMVDVVSRAALSCAILG